MGIANSDDANSRYRASEYSQRDRNLIMFSSFSAIVRNIIVDTCVRILIPVPYSLTSETQTR